MFVAAKCYISSFVDQLYSSSPERERSISLPMPAVLSRPLLSTESSQLFSAENLCENITIKISELRKLTKMFSGQSTERDKKYGSSEISAINNIIKRYNSDDDQLKAEDVEMLFLICKMNKNSRKYRTEIYLQDTIISILITDNKFDGLIKTTKFFL